ncbi:MAG: glycosyltransferase family 9 protein [Candidatus Gorgyraea atricola]|nr:glycosyltransferase family 9 protein [Candidatus Gorgyraea atricola]
MKIIFITLSNIGDVILTLPVLTALKDNFPGAKIDVVVGPRPKHVFAKDPRINRIFTYDKHASLKDKIAFVSKLRKEKYDLAVDMRNSLLPILIGAKKKTLLFSKNKKIHKRSAHLEKLSSFGIKYKNKQNIYISDEDKRFVDKLLEENGVKKGDVILGISPGSRSSLKRWSADGFIEVINEVLRQGRYKIVLIGESNERVFSHKDVIDLTGKTNLNQLFALIERMQLLLTCDSASLHIACDLGVKVIAIFGPTDAREYGPTGKDDVVIRKDLKCSPCKKALCKFNHECMSQLSAQEITLHLR